tara:strand:+ start:1589 stop:2179 length:591 start_codon:yes stop_codon:yes gene_type:complete
MNYIQDILEENINLHKDILSNNHFIQKIDKVVTTCLNSINNGGKLIFCGNGGSFADAQHLSAEFTVRFKTNRQSLPSIVLGANNSALTACANDYEYKEVFSRELSSIGQSNDVLIAISTSGNSPNILSVVKQANAMGITVVGLTGGSKGAMTQLCDCLEVPSDNTARVQECHILIGHILCEILESKYSAFGNHNSQ